MCSRYNLELDFSGVLRDTWTVIFNINTHTEKKKKDKNKNKKASNPFPILKRTVPFFKKIHPIPLKQKTEKNGEGLKGTA